MVANVVEDDMAVTYCLAVFHFLEVNVKVKVEHLYSAPSIDSATSEALRYMTRTKQRRTYLPYTFPAVAGRVRGYGYALLVQVRLRVRVVSEKRQSGRHVKETESRSRVRFVYYSLNRTRVESVVFRLPSLRLRSGGGL